MRMFIYVAISLAMAVFGLPLGRWLVGLGVPSSVVFFVFLLTLICWCWHFACKITRFEAKKGQDFR